MNPAGYGLDMLLAWRYLRGSRGFVSVISWISLAGMALGTGVLIVVLSVMNGFERELRLRILGVVPHLLLYPSAGRPLEQWQPLMEAASREDGIAAAAPWIASSGMLIGRRQAGVYLRGIDPQTETDVSVIGDFLQNVTLDQLQAGEFGIILGDDLARQLAVGTGDRVIAVVPRLNTGPAGIHPRIRRFEVLGVFALGAEMDSSQALIHMEDATALFRLPAPQAVRLRLDDLFVDGQWQEELAARLATQTGQSLIPVSWKTSYGTLFAAVQLERQMVALLLSIIILIAAFNILASLVMSVDSHRSEIAILRTMGATRARIVRIFILQGVGMGLVGMSVGTALGLIIAWQMEPLAAWLNELVFEYSGRRLFDAYFVHYLPSQIDPGQLPWVLGSALLLSALASIFPALRAMRLQPASVLRYQ